MPDPTLNDAIKEAYASAPSDEVILHTLELRHPAFIDDNGDHTAIRFVRDMRPGDIMTARLEDTAMVNPGEMVDFRCARFELTLPKVGTAPVPEITLKVDNVDREIVKQVERAAISNDKIEVTYRPYLSSDMEGPQMDPPMTMTITHVEANVFSITGKARIIDVGNKPFPAELYTAEKFPGIAQ